MKFIFFIIGGLIFGLFSNDEWGVWVGGFLGFLLAWIKSLSNKINQLESRLLDNEAKSAISASGFTSEQPVASQQTTVDEGSESAHDIDSIPAVAMDIENKSEWSVQQHSERPIDEPVSESLAETATDQLLTAQQMDEEDSDQNIPLIPAEDISLSDAQVEAEQAAAARVPAAPSASELAISKGIQKIKDWVVGYFTGGNSLVRTGMLVLFVGVAFLLKYVAERTVVPVEARYVGIVLGSLVLLGLGWRFRHKRPGFALSLQGGGIGVLYLTLFAAMRLHQLLPPSVVLLCLVGIVVLSATLAVLQNSMALAVIGIAGGFAAPILTSTGSGSHVQLFTYYLLLNFSILGIAWFKSWRLLNVVGFVATFAVGSVWGAQFYQPPYFTSVEPFLIAHFLLYVLIAVLFAFKQPPKLKGINDGTLIFGTPIVVFSLQAALVKDMDYGLAYSALIMGVFYVALAYLIKMLHRPFFKDLIESFIALGVGFGTLAIPLGFDGRVTSAMWVAEASALVWVGIRQSRMLPRFSGYALAVLGSLAFFVEPEANKNVLAFLNADFIGVLIIVMATAFMGLYARQHQGRLLPIETPWVSHLMLLATVLWWVVGGIDEINKHFNGSAYYIQQLWMLGTTLMLIYSAEKLTYRLLLHCALLVNVLMWPLLLNMSSQSVDEAMFFNPRFVALAVVGLFYLVMSPFWSLKLRGSMNGRIKNLNLWASRYFLAVGIITWLFAMVFDIHKFLPAEKLLWTELLMASTAAMLLWTGHKRQWLDFNWAALGVVFAMALPLYVTFVTLQWSLPPMVDAWPVFNVACLSLLIYCLAHFVMAYYWQAKMLKASDLSKGIAAALLLLALVIWFTNGVMESQAFLNAPHWLPAVIVFVSASWLLFVLLAHQLNWSDLHKVKYLATAVLVFLLIITPNFQDYHTSFGLLAWLMAFVVNYWLLKVYDKQLDKVSVAFHVVSLMGLSWLLMYELTQLIEWQFGSINIWHSSASVVMLLLIMGLVFVLRDRVAWPLKAHPVAYFYWALPLLMAIQWLQLLELNLSYPGGSSVLPYVPVLNVIDLVGIGSLYLAYKMQKTDQTKLFIPAVRIRYSLFAMMGFLLLNASMLRCFHYWYGIDYKLKDLMSSFMVQTGFSILWAATAVTLMVLAARKKWRPLWLLGLGLMIAVVAKLFLVDMSASGSIERIVAFLSVGFLLSVVGYFSPLPPENKLDKTTDQLGDHKADKETVYEQ